MENPLQHVVPTVSYAQLPSYLENAEPGEKRVIYYLKSCFHRKVKEERRWKVQYHNYYYKNIILCRNITTAIAPKITHMNIQQIYRLFFKVR